MEIDKLKKRKEVQAYRARISESPPEEDLFCELVKSGLRPQKQFPIKGFYADIAFPDHHLVIEYDGKEFHQDLQRDISREIVIKNAGYDVLRVGKTSRFYEIYLNGNQLKADDLIMDYDFAIQETAKIALKIVSFRDEKQNIAKYNEDAEGEIGDRAILKSAGSGLTEWYERLAKKYENA